ncbi:MAG: hypothetical protein UH071_03190 [Paludibacteraceae bacterium]|jgi:predicted RNA methylase|nr:hypothetical protein [Paludibacteraceae bacterium]
MYDLSLREEELKNKVAEDWFADFDTTEIIGNIDFSVALPTPKGQLSLFETEYLLWAESKKGNKNDIYKSFVQLILTIGKARTFEHHLPPAFLGAFDAEKIAFIPYHTVVDIFYQNDFNWNVTPSDHETKEFKLVHEKVTGILEKETLIYKYDVDEKLLKQFIQKNFVLGKTSLSKVRINKNNFVSIYQKWFDEVRDTIAVDWEKSRKIGIIAADFYLADILSEHNVSLKDKLFALLKKDHYELDRRIDNGGFLNLKTVGFKDKQKAHTQFWNRYDRPPRREYWDYIVERRDLLVPQDIRERKGSFFTPKIWVEKSQEYIADVLGENWQDEYSVWDCCAGTGNLLAGLTNKYNIWASTLDKQDVEIMKETMVKNGSLLETHVFQFDFLNDDFSKLPQGLQDIINDKERRKKLVVYINPPYAEVSTKKSDTDGKKTKTAVNKTMIHLKYTDILGTAGRELFAQFLIRIHFELSNVIVADFSTLKILQGSAFDSFRKIYTAKLNSLHLMPADTFDNVKGQFPIGFFIWNTGLKESFHSILADVYSAEGKYIEKKKIFKLSKKEYINAWISTFKEKGEIDYIGFLDGTNSNDFQHNNYVYIVNTKEQIGNPRGLYIDFSNLISCSIYNCIRHIIPATWLNDRDQFLYPNDGWKEDKEFQSDCLAYTLFNNNIQSQYGINHWIPFTEQEVDAKDNFKSHFMTNFMAGKVKQEPRAMTLDFGVVAEESKSEKIEFSGKAKVVMDAGRELWKYYHAQPNANVDASYYDIREHFQGRDEKGKMKSSSTDETYNCLLGNLREALKVLAKKIEPKVYEYGFLK